MFSLSGIERAATILSAGKQKPIKFAFRILDFAP